MENEINTSEFEQCIFVVAVTPKMSHKCDRENCRPEYVNGPKIKCHKCGRICFLGCFGFEAGDQIDGQQTVKCRLLSGCMFTMLLSCMAFQCCDQIMVGAEQKKALKCPKSTSNDSESRGNQSELFVNELKHIKEMLSSIKSATDSNTAEIAEIKSLSTKTDANVQKVTEQSAATSLLTPRAPGLQYVNDYRNRAISKGLGETPNKRKRFESVSRPSPRTSTRPLGLPEPKMGTNANVGRLSAIPQPNRSRDEQPKFEKALWVSRLSPDTSIDDVIDFITTNTPVTDKSKMNVHKLVKKGVDLASLQFVSFKVELSAEDLDILNEPNMWPSGMQVREFVQVPAKNVLGNFLPKSNAANHQVATDSEKQMDQS